MPSLQVHDVLLHHLHLADLLSDSVLELIPLCLELIGLISHDVELVLDKLEKIGEPRRRAGLLGGGYWSRRWDEIAVLIDVGRHGLDIAGRDGERHLLSRRSLVD